MKYSLCFNLFLCFLTISVTAQSVVVNKTTPDYASGQPIQYLVSGVSGTISYKIILDRKSNDDATDYAYTAQNTSFEQVVTTGTTTNGTISYTPLYAGVFICVINAGTSPNNMAAAVYDQPGIIPQNTEPFSPTFESFWDGIKADPSVATPTVTISNCTSNCAPTGYTSKAISVTVLGKTITGNMCYPNTGLKYPAILWPRAWFAPAASNSELHSNLGSTNCILISLNPKDAGTPDEATASDYTDRNTYNYKYTMAAYYAVTNYLYSTLATTIFDDTKGIGLWGESQGGGLSLLFAGINGANGRIKGICISNPATCEQRGYLNTKVSAFPDWVRNNTINNNGPSIADACRYYDAAVAASRITAPVYINIGYLDFVTPGMSTNAAMNNLKTSVSFVHSMQKKHEHGFNTYFDGNSGISAKFFKKHLTGIEFSSSTNSAYYFVNAGPSTTVATVGTALNLAGTAQWNGANYTGSMKWTWIQTSGSGGNVTFGNMNSLSTTATFSTAGTYRLKLESTNYMIVDPNGISNTFHSFADYITVTVTGGSCSNNVTAGGTISGDQSLCDPYDPTNITSTTLPTGGTGVLEYVWESSTIGSSGPFSVVSGATIATYDPPSISQTTWYRRGARRAGCTTYLYSNIATKTVSNVSAAGVIAGDQTACGSSYDPTLITSTTPASGGSGSIIYGWEKSTTSSSAGFSVISGVTTTTYDPPAITQTTWFRRTAKTGSCAVKYSNVVTKTLTSVCTDVGVTITANPTTYTQFGVVTFTVKAKNLGTSTVSNVIVRCTIPTSMVLTSPAPSVTGGTFNQYCAGGVICWEWAGINLTPSQEHTLTLPLFQNGTGSQTVTATIFNPTAYGDGVSGNNTASVNISTLWGGGGGDRNMETSNTGLTTIRPNPAFNELQVNLPADTYHSLAIYNMDGKNVYTEQVVSKVQTLIDIAALPSGIYLIRLHGKGINEILKFVKI